MNSRLPSRDLVLIGAGHTNLHVVRMWRMAPIDDVQLTLVSPFGQATYSGMLPGVLAGLYERSAMEIDLARFANSCGARLILTSAIGLDPAKREILFADRPPIRYDAVSIGIGSVPAHRESIVDSPEAAPDVLAIKPMATFIERLDAQIDRKILRGDKLSIAVVGGGAGGVEIAFALRARFERRKLPVSIALVDRGEDLLSSYLPGVREKVRRRLAEKGIDVHLGQPPIGYSDGQLFFANGAALAATILIWAVGAAPSAALAGFQLPKAADGFIAVRPTLQSISDDAVFAVGDSATIQGHPLPKAGVYAVRQGPVLWRNLRRYFAQPSGGESLEAYGPQSGFLSLLSTGDSRAIGQYKGFAFEGKWAWRWIISIASSCGCIKIMLLCKWPPRILGRRIASTIGQHRFAAAAAGER
jgi:selenide,water dikinase